ncbi:membrane protein [Streptococcus equinus]|uniref:anti sigma factor C-terminal domain-containing protein n=1 Tax=Streptococcus equinus TaxID=1335 RepID=UPI000F70FE8A|nr:anti sigma factor C-terminal domain-containing protein [Streptococcus equinus]VEE23199.1 membrane protein [Streptococcus equinus]
MKISNNFEKIAVQNKRKNQLKIVIISAFMVLLSILIVFLGLRLLTNHNGESVKENYLLKTEIAYPNVEYTTWGFEANSECTGTFYSHRFKNIDGISVPFEEYRENYSILRPMSASQSEGLEEGDSYSSHYTHGNLYKVPIFYNVNAKSSNMKVTQDISKVEKMKDEAVEMAITFDKPYTYEEITEMVPDNLLVNWYWIGTSGLVDTTNLGLSSQLGFSPIENDYVAGFKQFKTDLKKAIHLGILNSQYSDGGETLSLEEDAKAYLKKAQKHQEATFSGIILTGRSENFLQLIGKEWIHASNIGHSVTIQPYHTLSK